MEKPDWSIQEAVKVEENVDFTRSAEITASKPVKKSVNKLNNT